MLMLGLFIMFNDIAGKGHVREEIWKLDGRAHRYGDKIEAEGNLM